MANYHAIVFGASGIIGWPVVNQLLSGYPEPGLFSRVTAVTNRPIEVEESQWTNNGPGNMPELQLVSGIDLRNTTTKELADGLRAKVKDIEKVSHVYYFVFTQVQDSIEEVAVNKGMLEKVVESLSSLSSNVKFVLFPGGTRGYGIYNADGTFKAPLTESMVNNLPADYAKTVVYPANRTYLSEACHGKDWTWCEVCPDAIIGFTPNGSQYSLALHWGQYLSLYAYNHGIEPRTESSSNKEPAKVSFPGNKEAYSALCSPVSGTIIGRFSVYASLHPETCGGGRLFNVADREEPSTFGDVWPALASWFGLVGTESVKEGHAATIGDDALDPGH
ncbi:Uu.00g028700.m01.CDS01 [Anthostomella pinea]|uniref:Uu.00g028700.m01.CDS01 n=1 Tax=Anthostomella pinea TaxID=933095 RepID=A0AAI8V8G8_9PEZI|nr:Uu.00g028700.m01.CDS01 [Anthostomella pinea]